MGISLNFIGLTQLCLKSQGLTLVAESGSSGYGKHVDPVLQQ
jgi:hypothetical protein